MEDLINGRCRWCGNDEIYIQYHDQEWGKPVTDDRILFEFFMLESAQAGLSWLTILKKREGYRKAFHDFDVQKVATMASSELEILYTDSSIIRNRRKIDSAVSNAQIFIAIQEEFGSFYRYILSFFPDHKPIVNNYRSMQEIPPTSDESDAISKDLKKRGVKFFGSTICYAFLQATGFVDDHLAGCISRK